MSTKPRIVHVISGLRPGGAEILLLEFIRRADRSRFDPMVISLAGGGELKAAYEETGMPVISLNIRSGPPDPRAIASLVRLLRAERPAAIQTWMYHANLIGGIAAMLAGRMPVAWGIHHSNLSPEYIKRSTFQVARAGARLSSRIPRAIVCCAESSKVIHEEIGYDPNRMMVIPNGFDTDRFRPDPAARLAIRQELGLAPETPLIGMLARFSPQKDHHNFVRSAAVVAEAHPEAHFLLAGFGVTPENEELISWIAEAGMIGRIHPVGSRSDTPQVNAALDVAVLSSQFREAFPLVIGEAMACGVQCAVTNVGDAARIVSDLGRVAAPKDPEALGHGIVELLDRPAAERTRSAEIARRRIVEHYNMVNVLHQYEDLWTQLQTGSPVTKRTWSARCV
jgi:glycosyltransferase involved in cell wall biosynthesis